MLAMSWYLTNITKDRLHYQVGQRALIQAMQISAMPELVEAVQKIAGDVRRMARLRAVRMAKIAAALAVVLAGVGLFWVYRTSAEASRLEEETAGLMSSLKPGGAPAGETPLVSAANKLYQARRERLSAAAMLNEVSAVLPSTVYLVGLTLDGDQLTIKGQGSGVPDIDGHGASARLHRHVAALHWLCGGGATGDGTNIRCSTSTSTSTGNASIAYERGP